MQTKVKDLMTCDPIIVSSNCTLKDAAQEMGTADCGVLPVGSWDKLEGIITDRDIVIRAVAKGKDINTMKVKDCMTSDIFYCNMEDTIEQAAKKMKENNVSRLVVKDNKGKACGIITFGCLLRKSESKEEIGKVVECAVGKKAA